MTIAKNKQKLKKGKVEFLNFDMIYFSFRTVPDFFKTPEQNKD